MNNKGANQIVQIRRLICAFVVPIWHKQAFSWRSSYYTGNNWKSLNLTLHDHMTGSDILSLVEVQHWHHKWCDENDVIKFACNDNWNSAHWLSSFKASPDEYDAAFLMVSFTFFICILSEFFHILDQWKGMSLTRVIKVYPICMIYIPINGNEDRKSGWCEFYYFSQ